MIREPLALKLAFMLSLEKFKFVCYRETIRDKLIPQAVLWFTGEADQETYGDFEVDDDDNEDDDVDDIVLECEEEEEDDEDDEEEDEEGDDEESGKKVMD